MRLSFVAGLVLVAVACANAPPVALLPGPFAPLGPDEGILVVQLDLGVAVREIVAAGTVIARDLQPGEHIWIVRLEPGRYRWTEVRLSTPIHGASTLRPKPVGVVNEKEFDFDVEAGKINYPGHLLVALHDPTAGAASGITIRNRNHSAMAIRKLSKSHPELLAAHPIRYSGHSGDGFLDFYTRAREQLKTSAHRAGTNAEEKQ